MNVEFTRAALLESLTECSAVINNNRSSLQLMRTKKFINIFYTVQQSTQWLRLILAKQKTQIFSRLQMNYWIRHVNDEQRYHYSGAVSLQKKLSTSQRKIPINSCLEDVFHSFVSILHAVGCESCLDSRMKNCMARTLLFLGLHHITFHKRKMSCD